MNRTDRQPGRWVYAIDMRRFSSKLALPRRTGKLITYTTLATGTKGDLTGEFATMEDLFRRSAFEADIRTYDAYIKSKKLRGARNWLTEWNEQQAVPLDQLIAAYTDHHRLASQLNRAAFGGKPLAALRMERSEAAYRHLSLLSRYFKAQARSQAAANAQEAAADWRRPYVIYPGQVVSKTDGDVHHISAPRLAELYQVPLALCHISRHDATPYDLRRYEHLTALTPRYDGNYSLEQQP